ncbi:MAG: hydantoinase/oxoprolinase family protein [bacterium]|nr:hydantoinase/oxoprolinase family protein [bacterium]
MQGGWQVGIDTGGTFTDLVAVRGDEQRIAKVPSTPSQFDQGVLDSIAAAGIEVSCIETIAHGTTVATNAVITQTGAPTALLTTRGFRDVLELRRHNRGDPYDIQWDPPPPLVARRNRFEISERLDYAGDVVVPLDAEQVRAAARLAARRGIGTFAIAFLHSYVNPVHEDEAAEIVRSEVPGAFVSTSAALLAEPPEFERTSTAVLNAYLAPVVSDYLTALEDRLREAGFGGRLYVMHSGGGLLTSESASRFPARLLTSGPAAGAKAAEGVAASTGVAGGVVAAGVLASAEGLDEVISLDIGGTSADIAVVQGGRADIVHEFSPRFGQPARFPAIDLVTIGAGGGSIAWVDAGRLPHVGPQSAGADPGPAAYLGGGTEATVTDANLVAGRLMADVALAGGISLDVGAARRAVGAFGDELGLSVADAALGIIDICNNNMARSIRVVTVERGLDPRNFTLVPFGGAGPLMAAELADVLGIARIVVPLAPGVTSGLGCLYVDIAHDIGEALICELGEADRARLQEVFDRLGEAMRQRLADDGVGAERQRLEYSIDLRYLGQVRALTVGLGTGAVPERFAEEYRGLFFEEYERQFHSVAVDIPVEISALRVRGVRRSERPHLPFRGSTAPLSTKEVPVLTRAGTVVARLAERARLHVGSRLSGPLILTQEDSTTWVPPHWEVEADRLGNLQMTRSE